MRAISIVFLLLATVFGGCGAANGPYRVTADGQTYLTQRVNYDLNDNTYRLVDDVSGAVWWSKQRPKIEKIDQIAYQAELAAGKQALNQRGAEIVNRYSDYIGNAYRQEIAREIIRHEVEAKDWQRWYDVFRANGYTDAEAAFKADQMVGWESR